jgi:hypothetical protein
VIRHVFLDDMPTLKEYCAWNWSKQQETDGPKADNLEKEQMDLLMHKVYSIEFYDKSQHWNL